MFFVISLSNQSDLFFHFPQFPNRQRAFTYSSSSPHFHFHTRSSLPFPSLFYCRPSPLFQLLIFLNRQATATATPKQHHTTQIPTSRARSCFPQFQSHLFSLTKNISQLFLVSDPYSPITLILFIPSHPTHPIPPNPTEASLLSNSNIHAPPCLLLFSSIRGDSYSFAPPFDFL